ncbi:MAG: hypothetical protein ABSC94_03435 [Polyangiaceae bacterium]|jgi:hypothetical protein
MSGPHESPPTTFTDFDPLCASDVSIAIEYADWPLHPIPSMIPHSDGLGGEPTVSDSKSSHSGKLPQLGAASPCGAELEAFDELALSELTLSLLLPLLIEVDAVVETAEVVPLGAMAPSAPLSALEDVLAPEGAFVPTEVHASGQEASSPRSSKSSRRTRTSS